ncbi:MAG: AHH domain-containing protein [bacterium]|nr:AHH domain-containing protein [bacterium]
MGVEYLSEAALFVCPFGMQYKAVEPGNQKAYHQGQKMLTQAARLVPAQPPIPCPLLPTPAGPLPCPCIVAPPLFDTVIHSAKGPLVTKKAWALCSVGQKVTPQLSGTNGHILYNNAASAKVAAIAWPEHKTAEPEKPAGQDVALSASRGITRALAATLAPIAAPSDKLELSPERGETLPQPLSQPAEAEAAPRPGMFCSCSANQPECRDCAYRQDNAPADVDNDSRQLRDNYNAAKPHADSYDVYFDETVEPLGNGKPNKWRYAAHHLLSGNQVFKNNSELVRLARFCGYDINAYENCIMLVGYPEDYPDSERMKHVTAYDVMSEGRVQWHVGGHSYTFADAEEKAMICKQIGIRNKIAIGPEEIKSYAELVQEEIDRLTDRLNNKKNRDLVCFASKQAQAQLCAKLNRISQKIKAKLAAFAEEGKPHHSFPYYVSKEAYRFTYGLPRTGKVITVLQENGQIVLAKYRLERFTEAIADKTRNLLIKPGAAQTFSLSDNNWKRECVGFCDNVQYFVYLDGASRNILPFSVDSNRQFPPDSRHTGRDGRKFLDDNNTELLVWLKDNSPNEYVSPAVMVKKRLQELGEAVN